ncbi:hypothetical protein BOX15_Mlig007414g1 [Macrostomum lignano]|nr:hypothetical protein [Macrostomum lignano]PAA50619.1 hypothetical protein BOX15_Mlig000668g18 [Macrostomum lignano]PAA69832.1 hypothetical protein BOX15_Mlig022263g1 [Macrostomum lignano]PAA80356.1 hypothetical protein BOX15_Mlig000668g27 [Macrostomum lignano]PAA81317.1 hypothetical protein BOX15_Mlig002843g2 [Macrostomum lignano]
MLHCPCHTEDPSQQPTEPMAELGIHAAPEPTEESQMELEYQEMTSDDVGNLTSSTIESALHSDDNQCARLEAMLRDWVKATGPEVPCVNYLLQNLQDEFPGLAADYRGLMTTPRELTFRYVNPGRYYHFGVKAGLDFLLSNIGSRSRLDSLNLHLFVDGAKVHNSTTYTLWPVLGRVSNLSHSVFIIGLYYGTGKPLSASDFLADCITELRDLMADGFVSTVTSESDLILPFKLSMITCDSPARSFVKGTKACWGYFGCDKCTVEGDFCNGRVTFSDLSAALRTDFGFRGDVYPNHVLLPSPFLSLPIDMVHDFPLDPMHLIYEGIVPKCLKFLGKGRLPHRASGPNIRQISADLCSISSCIPHDFARKPRSIECVGLWKATEFRLFILYLAPIVLAGNVPESVYQLFLSLHSFVFLLSHPLVCQTYCSYAEDLAKHIVNECAIIWGDEFIVYTVHSIIHIPSEVRRRGPLDSFSCFWGENFIRFITQFVRSPRFALEQTVKRILERDVTLGFFPKHMCSIQSPFEYSGPIASSNVDFSLQGVQTFGIYRKVSLVLRGTYISVANPDCYILTRDGFAVVVTHIISTDVGCIFVGKKFIQQTALYDETFDSMSLHISVVNTLSNSLVTVRWTDFYGKAMLVSLKNRSCILPILHTLVDCA